MKKNISLARKTTLGTGGVAKYFIEVATIDDVVSALRFADGEGLPSAVIGLGSNLLVADEGFPGVVIRLVGHLASVSTDGTILRAGGGASLAVCLHRAREASLGRFEFVCAIPGTVGGGVWMNAGAYGGDIAGVLERALVVDCDGARWKSKDDLELSYRSSNLCHGEVVAQAEFTLMPVPTSDVRMTIADMQAARKASQPTNRRTFGSVFVNPNKEMSAGRVIEEVGLRGHVIGGARISPVHANFIENSGKATTSDVLSLIRLVRERVGECFGVRLETEVQFLGPRVGEKSWPPDDLVASSIR